jgi:acyl-CoA synthetase (AMP-forming)/AMP-acid ligase II
MTGFDAADYIRAAEEYRATQFFLSVSMLNALLDSPALSPRTFDNASFVSAGADEVKPSHHRRLAQYTSLPLSVRYSSTESTAVTMNESGTRMTSVGKPFEHFRYRLYRSELTGPGELLLKGPGGIQRLP